MPCSSGTLCLRSPFSTTKAVTSGASHGSAADTCDGRWQIDFNAVMSHVNQFGNPFVPGMHVQAQFLGRDPGLEPPDNLALSAAIDFELTP